MKDPEPDSGQEKLRILRRRRKIAALAVPFAVLLTPLLNEAALLLSAGLLAYCLILTVEIGRMSKHLGPASSGPVKLTAAKTIGWAAAILVFDGLVLGQGIISGVVLAYAVLLLVPMGILTRKDTALGRFRLKKAGILATAMLAVLGSIYLNNRLAERMADDLISGVVQYKEKHGQYPEQLQDLVPEFMPGIPAAKLTLSYNNFSYSSRTSPMLWYVELPPAVRRIYYFESGQWGTLY